MRWLIVVGLLVTFGILVHCRDTKLPTLATGLNEFGRVPTSSPVLPNMSSEQTRLLIELPSSPSLVDISPQVTAV